MSFSDNGFEMLNDIVNQVNIDSITAEIISSDIKSCRGGIRNAEKKYISIKELASSETLLNQARNYLFGQPKIVRVIYFDKTPENNWLVTWHQDKTVAVTKRFEIKGWGAWSLKDGTQHVQPSLKVLNNMITFRIHLDATNEKNGCLKVIPGSHKHGVFSQTEILQYSEKHEAVSCIANRGATLVMRPHLLHSSSKAVNPSSRRIIHIEYSGYSLPEGVAWA